MIAGGVYRRAGVSVLWLPGTDRDASASDPEIVIVAAAAEAKFPVGEDSLGVARGSDSARATTAYVFSDRVRDFGEHGHIDAWIVLGCAIAHELGHLLLPVNSHSSDGIMQAHWDPKVISRASGFLSFAPDQGRLLRLRVVSRVASREPRDPRSRKRHLGVRPGHATLTRLTFGPAVDGSPVWTPDGRRIVFGSSRGGAATNLYWQRADNTGTVERLTTNANPQNPRSIGPDGKALVVSEIARTCCSSISMCPPGGPGGSDAAVPGARGPSLPVTTEKRVELLIQTPAQDQNAEISPDGRWLADQSNASGQPQIYVRPFPKT
jgi:hypothetical protein